VREKHAAVHILDSRLRGNDGEEREQIVNGHFPYNRLLVTLQCCERLPFDEHIMAGRTCIRRMRIPVSVIVRQIAHCATFKEILHGYPDLQVEDVQQTVGYASCLAQEELHCRKSSP